MLSLVSRTRNLLSKDTFAGCKAWAHKTTGPKPASSLYNAAEFLRRATSTVFTGILTIGGISYYLAQAKKNRRMEQCQYLPEDENYKASNIRFVSFKDCVLSEEMVMSGRMEQIQNFKARAGDVFVSSFPKSGTTWVQEVVYQLFLGRCSSEAQTIQDPSDAKQDQDSILNYSVLLNQTDNVMETRFPYLEHIYPGIKDIEKRPGGRLIKTHLPAHLLPPSVFTNSSKVIYIYRNPKDVVVSYYHFARMLTFINYRGSFHSFLVEFMRNKVPYAPYFPHLFGYMDKAEADPKSVLVLCYEDMKEDPVREVEKIAKFLNLSLQPHELDKVAQVTSFEAMKENPTTNYQHWDNLGLRDRQETTFMRKGEVGDHKNFLDSDFDEAFNSWMQRSCMALEKKLVDFKFSLKSSENFDESSSEHFVQNCSEDFVQNSINFEKNSSEDYVQTSTENVKLNEVYVITQSCETNVVAN